MPCQLLAPGRRPRASATFRGGARRAAAAAALAGIVPGESCSIPEAAESAQRDGASFDAVPATVQAGSRSRANFPSELLAGSFAKIA